MVLNRGASHRFSLPCCLTIKVVVLLGGGSKQKGVEQHVPSAVFETKNHGGWINEMNLSTIRGKILGNFSPL